MSQEIRNHYKKAGYAYLIRFETWVESLGAYVKKSFPTTSDALSHHLAAISANTDNKQIEVDVL
jgi:hypothetical protein